MPSAQHLSEFARELKTLGNEPDTLKSWGTLYDDLPPPESTPDGAQPAPTPERQSAPASASASGPVSAHGQRPFEPDTEASSVASGEEVVQEDAHAPQTRMHDSAQEPAAEISLFSEERTPETMPTAAWSAPPDPLFETEHAVPPLPLDPEETPVPGEKGLQESAVQEEDAGFNQMPATGGQTSENQQHFDALLASLDLDSANGERVVPENADEFAAQVPESLLEGLHPEDQETKRSQEEPVSYDFPAFDLDQVAPPTPDAPDSSNSALTEIEITPALSEHPTQTQETGTTSPQSQTVHADASALGPSASDPNFSPGSADNLVAQFPIEESVQIPPFPADGFELPGKFQEFARESESPYFSPDTTADADQAQTISETEYQRFLQRLDALPLPVRIAVQEYLSSEETSDKEGYALISSIANNASPKAVATQLEHILKKPLHIPRKFERKSAAAHEREKSSLPYIAKHTVLPLTASSAAILIFILSLAVLSWHFLYKPLHAHLSYRAGYHALELDRYEDAHTNFEHAKQYWKIKHWYFRYARALRDKKQYTRAEQIYTELLFDFRHPKQGSIEYAHMLCNELRKYEQAETTLRRQGLDHHPNDPDILSALGDVYLEWAEEDPAQYEQARKTYQSLIASHGTRDAYLARMMRYFIRTDQLAQVLPLKAHFTNTRARIAPEDLTELSGYLLEKRYESQPSDSLTLQSKIEDLRALLERAFKADPMSADAAYYLGKFFVYNHRKDSARELLQQAVNRYPHMPHSTVRRTLREIDAMRLLGTLLLEEKGHAAAREIFTQALTRYRSYIVMRDLPPHRTIGKLYRDYADMDYFIYKNYDSALEHYQHARAQLLDTPEVQYKIGYIQHKKNNYPEAIRAMNAAYEHNPQDKHLLYGFGTLLCKRGD